MELHIIDAIKRDLAGVVAALGDEEVVEQWRRLAEAVEPSLRLRLIDLLSEVALSLNSQLDVGHVEVRMAGRDPELVFVDEPPAPEEPPAPGDDLSARITLRLPEGLKASLEVAAAREAVSTNAWIVRALARALEPRARGDRPIGSRASPGARRKGAPMFSLALFGPFDPDPVERRRPPRRGDGRVDPRPSVPPRIGPR